MLMESREKTVLVVEDEETFIEVLGMELSRAGYEVVVARDGAAALQAYEDSDPDVVLLDLMIPKVPGLEVCRELRSHSNVPIVIVSARADEDDILAGFDAGADDYISKPFRLRALVQRVSAVVHAAREEEAEETDRLDQWLPTGR